MEPLTKADLLNAGAYERERREIRRRVMVIKDRRRVIVGPACSVHFESRETISYQVHEMLRAERSWDRPGAAEDELAAYNPLIPGHGELSATVMFEHAIAEERQARLAALVGIDRHLWLTIGDQPPLPAVFDRMQMDEGRISAVQFVKWRLGERHRELLRQEGTVVRLSINHPQYHAQSVVSEATRAELSRDAD